MDSSKSDITHSFDPYIRVYRDGRVERFVETDVAPTSIDPKTGVSSKDVVIEPETGVSARIYMPNITNTAQKLPLLIYFHGGGFCIASAFSPTYHNHLNSLAAEANALVVSLDYRLAPEHPIPTAYEDSWVGIQWVASHFDGDGSEAWLRDYVDFGRVFLGGDSAGANIAHNMAMRAEASSVKLLGVALIHPYFWGEQRIGSEAITAHKEIFGKLWLFVSPSSTGCDDPLINPAAVGAPSLSGLGCDRVLICVAEKDVLRDRGWLYYEELKKSGWGGAVEIMETEGVDHVFHLLNPTHEKAPIMIQRLASFLSKE